MKIIIKAQILLVLLYLIVPVKGELQSLSFLSSNSVDVSSSEKNIPFTYTPSENFSNIQVILRQDKPTGFGRFYGWQSSDDLGPRIQVPRFIKPGKWIIEQIDYRASGNRTTYARDLAAFYGSWASGTDPKALPASIKQLEIQVANTVIDDAAPTLIDFSVDMEQLRYSYDGGLYAPCTITVEDKLSGFDSAYISFGEVSADFNSYFKVIGLTNVYEGKIYFWNPEVNKTYNFESARVEDQSGNAIYISSSGQTYSDGYYQINSSPTTGTPFDNLAIQLPETFIGLPRDSGYSSGLSSGVGGTSGGGAADVKKSKKGKGKSSAKKTSGSKKSGGKKSGGKKAKKK
jgi:hypothetical protein